MSEVKITKCQLPAREVGRFLREVDEDFPIPLSKKANLDVLATKLASRADVIAAADEGGVLAMVAGYARNAVDDRAYVSVVATSRRARGRGLAKRLLEEFCEEARCCGIGEVHLYCDPRNEAAALLYRSLGFFDYPDVDEQRLEDLHFHLTVCDVDGRPCLTQERPNILLSSVGRRTYLVDWFKKAMGGEGLVCVTNSDPMTPAFASADVAAVSPLIYSKEYIPFLIDFCERNNVGAVIPLFDIDVPILAAHRAELREAGVTPIVAPAPFARACSDKLETATLLSSAGIACPMTFVGVNGFVDAVEEGRASFPAFVKPRWGMGSIGLAIASDECELRVLCGIVERKVASSYLKYESAVDPSRAVIVQPVLAGREFGMDVVNDLSGRYRSCAVRRKVAMRAGETDVAEVLPADLRFETLARKLSALSRHPGNMDVDVFEIDGELTVLEMNVRFGGGYPFSHAAGMNLPRALVTWLRGGECNPSDLEVTAPGLYMKDISVARLD